MTSDVPLGRRAWRERALLGLLRMLSIVLLGLGAGVFAAAPSQTLNTAEFSRDQGASWSPVMLPDTWAQRGLPAVGEGQYRLHFDLVELPREPWALAFARISSSREVRLNGTLIEIEAPQGRLHPVSEVIELPTAALRVGSNELIVDLRYRVRGGVSSADVGPASLLHAQHDAAAIWSRELPRSLNIGMAVLALIMLMVRWRRPNERALGLFGAMGLIGSVRNYIYFTDVTLLPSTVTDWLFFLAQVWTVTLFGAYAQSLHRSGPSAQLRRIYGAALGLSVLFALLLPPSWLPLLRLLVYPLLLLVGALAVRQVWRAARSDGDAAHYTLVGSLALAVLAGVHDYLFQQGRLPITDTFWLPFVMPVALGVVSTLLLNRLVSAMSDVERLNATLERRVSERTQALEEANAAKTRFLAAASHDMRQPIATIGLLIGLVREQVANVVPVRAMVDRIYEAVGSMEALLNGLMDLSRLEPETLKARLQPVPLAWIFDAIALHEQTVAAHKGLRLRFRPTALVVTSDPVLLDQIVRNLVSNALRYTERGGVLVGARRRADGRAIVQVWDTGIGIPEEAQTRVFEEFVQLANPGRDRGRGQGLGLAIVRRGARALGHSLSLRSVPGRGSCFAIELPLAATQLAPGAPALAAPKPLHACNLWLIEDDAAVRDALAMRLTRWGAQVSALGSVADVRRQLDTCHAGAVPLPALIVSDQRLPDGSGLECIALIRAHAGPALPAVVVTGDIAPDDLAQLDRAGLPVLHKPFRAAELLALLHATLPAPDVALCGDASPATVG